jgi:hypothetical protein
MTAVAKLFALHLRAPAWMGAPLRCVKLWG